MDPNGHPCPRTVIWTRRTSVVGSELDQRTRYNIPAPAGEPIERHTASGQVVRECAHNVVTVRLSQLLV